MHTDGWVFSQWTQEPSLDQGTKLTLYNSHQVETSHVQQCLYLPQVGLCCTPDHNHHGDIEEGEEEDRDQEEDNEGDLMDWVPLKHKVYEINKN